MASLRRSSTFNSCADFSISMSERFNPAKTSSVINFIGALLVLLTCSGAAYSASSPPKMRPYSGIGVLVLPLPALEPYHLYEEPGIFRQGELNGAKTSGNEWIFGVPKKRTTLIVVARKNNWLKVCYDDAGREAWIDTQHRGTFQTWEQFMKGQVVRLLPGLRKPYYQMYRQPWGITSSTLTPKQPFKVLRLENDWIMVMPDQNTIGWLRWRDEDGRILTGSGPELK